MGGEGCGLARKTTDLIVRIIQWQELRAFVAERRIDKDHQSDDKHWHQDHLREDNAHVAAQWE